MEKSQLFDEFADWLNWYCFTLQSSVRENFTAMSLYDAFMAGRSSTLKELVTQEDVLRNANRAHT